MAMRDCRSQVLVFGFTEVQQGQMTPMLTTLVGLVWPTLAPGSM